MIQAALHVFARNLLAAFGKNTAVFIRVSGQQIEVCRARDGFTLGTVTFGRVSFDGRYWHDTQVFLDGQEFKLDSDLIAYEIMGRKSFPRTRKFNRSWSPVVLNKQSQAILAADSGARFA